MQSYLCGNRCAAAHAGDHLGVGAVCSQPEHNSLRLDICHCQLTTGQYIYSSGVEGREKWVGGGGIFD